MVMQQIGSKTTILLIDDQKIIAEAIKKMVCNESDIIFHYCIDPTQALEKAIEIKPTVILQDLLMPGIDGLTLVRYFRAHPTTSKVPMIVLSAKEDPQVKAEAFALGANDYVVKLPEKAEFLARIRYHSNNYRRLLERNEAFERLEESQNNLNAELAEAGQYVHSLLPQPLKGLFGITWKFIPSIGLGGDVFDYFWIDDEHFMIYLLDVCGHGVGAALLSISIMNFLRQHVSQDFIDPAKALGILNETFPMEKHSNMFFTIWFGIYNKSKRELTYSSGGHPPAVLFLNQNNSPVLLKAPGLVVGGMQDSQYQTNRHIIPPNSSLYVFSDGIYEIFKQNRVLRFYEFVTILEDVEKEHQDLDVLIFQMEKLNNGSHFMDDVSILKMIFQ